MSAAHYRYKNASLSYTPDGGSAISIDGVSSIGFSVGGSVIDLSSDASDIVQETPIVGRKGTLSVTSLNQGLMQALDQGNGSVSFTLERVKSGRGAVAAADIQVTAANATLHTLDNSADSVPGGQLTLSWDIADNGSDGLFAFS
jgi:hypothetical protein